MIFKTPNIGSLEQEIIGEVDELRKKLKNYVQEPSKWVGVLRRNMKAQGIRGSNTIEGYHATFEEAVAVVENEEIDVDLRTRLALNGYRSALTYILRLAGDQLFKINEELLRSLHYMMLEYNQHKHPGQWRPGVIYVRREPSGERVYEGPDADMVPTLMREFVDDLQSCDESVPVMVRAAMAHLNLVMIHPFSDGNGRMGRALQTLVLARDGILPPEFSSIEEFLGSRSNTDRYYEVLAEVGQGSWNPQNDATRWVRFCLLAHLQQATTIERRIREIARLWSDLEAEVERLSLHQRMLPALYDAAIGFRVRSERYQVNAEVSAQVASKDLKALVGAGLIIAKGEKRGRFYVGSESLFSIRENAREKRKAVPSDLLTKQLGLF